MWETIISFVYTFLSLHPLQCILVSFLSSPINELIGERIVCPTTISSSSSYLFILLLLLLLFLLLFFLWLCIILKFRFTFFRSFSFSFFVSAIKKWLGIVRDVIIILIPYYPQCYSLYRCGYLYSNQNSAVVDVAHDELQCSICLELFQDPRSLPCLHTFCVECIQRTLNDKHSLKCPKCRAEYQLGEEGAKLLPVNSYACQELPRKRLRQQLEKDEKKCESCDEAECADVAWCSECGIICKSCLANHKKMACLKDHEVIQTEDQESLLRPPTKKINNCLRHSGQELKYLCTCRLYWDGVSRVSPVNSQRPCVLYCWRGTYCVRD